VARSSKKAIESLLPLSSTKSCQPIGAASKQFSREMGQPRLMTNENVSIESYL
jgi:hypothetical protein